MENTRRGVHIAFEGIDGSGLTTHSRRLVDELSNMGYKSEYFKEPTKGPIGDLIRSFLRGDDRVRHDLLALLFAADRLWNYHASTKPIALLKEQGYIVVSDRYKYSSAAYQGAFTDLEWVWIINSRVPHADIIVYLDVPVDVALRRIELRSKNGVTREHYEKAELLEKIRRNYEVVLRKAEEEGVVVIKISGVDSGGERSIEDVAREIKEKIVYYITSRR